MISGLYIHIPFCHQGCTYCHFTTVPYDSGIIGRYQKAVAREITLYAACGSDRQVDSIYFGGGTPSLVPAECITEILEACRKAFAVQSNCEISMEANPGTLREDNVRIYAQAGINRVSLGMQSAHKRELRAIGRDHGIAAVRDSVRLLKNNRIHNISLDVLLGLPSQTFESWRETVRCVVALDVPHLSVYMLDLDEPCPLAEIVAEGSAALPEDDCIAEMYLETIRLLSSYAYVQYEISNFARKGYACRHNLKYWERKPVLGFGLSSHSYDGSARYGNVREMQDYLQALESCSLPVDWRGEIDAKQALEETLFLGLRMNAGIDWARLCANHGDRRLAAFERILRDLGRAGLVEWSDSVVRLTPAGMLLSNEIFQSFV